MSTKKISNITERKTIVVAVKPKQLAFIELLFGSLGDGSKLIAWTEVCGRNYDISCVPKWFLDLFTELSELKLPYDTVICFEMA